MYWRSPRNRLSFKHHIEWGWTTWVQKGWLETYWKGRCILRHLGVKTPEKGLAAEATRPLPDISGREGQSFAERLRMHRVKDRTVVFWVSPVYPMSSCTPSTRTEQMCYQSERKAGSLCSHGTDTLIVVQRQHWTRLTWRAIIWKLGCFQFMISVCLHFYSGGEEHPKANRHQAVRIAGKDYFRKGILFFEFLRSLSGPILIVKVFLCWQL